jgi:hypothetical protein
MNKRLLIGGIIAFIVIFNLGYLFHEVLAYGFFKANFGPGVQRENYNIPVIFLAFVIYIFLMALVYPVFRYYFKNKTGISKLMTGVITGLLFGFLWDALQGGIIEYATYNVSLKSMLVDSAYHFFEGGLAGAIIGLIYKDN